MPDHCCVPNCRSNYKGTDEYISVFKFPKNDELQKLWMRKIPREDFNPGPRAVVCEKHFDSNLITRYDLLPSNGEILKIPRKLPKLKEGAFPTIFPGCPKYLSEEKINERKSRDQKLKEIDDSTYSSFLEADKIKSFQDLKNNIQSKNFSENVFIFCKEKCVYILFMDWEPTPQVQKSIKIDAFMQITVCIGDVNIDFNKIAHILSQRKLNLWSELENIVTLTKNMEESSIEDCDKAFHHWSNYVNCSFKDPYSSKNFILEQMKLHKISKMAKRYSCNLLTFAYSLYIKSPTCYLFLYSSNFLSLPSLEHLKRLSSQLNINQSTLSESNISYLKAKSHKINDREKIVNLLIDEVHIKPKIEFKGKCLKGFAENKLDCETEATSIQSFMICSLFSDYKEIIGLVPVTKLTADELQKLCIQALKLLHECGFQTLSIISDNNRINRNMFMHFKFKDDSHNCIYINPVNNQDLFLLFDSVHLLKSIRNNWINQADAEKSFCCPEFGKSDNLIRISFDKLRKVYNIEKKDCLKLAPKLSFKALYPSSLERQNVKLALDIFHETNTAALETISNSNFNGWENTAFFIQLIKKWWDIFNISNPNKGLFTRNPNSDPFKSVNDERLTFLFEFSEWLKQWKSLKQKPRSGCLSEETFHALTHTSLSLIALIKYCLTVLNASYILTSKFQTDNLESRFGIYRQMSGGNYHISLQQVFETERKLKVNSLLSLRSAKYGDIPVKIFLSDITLERKVVDVTEFKLVLENIDLNAISKKDMEILYYIGGYCLHKLNISCNSCKEYFFNDEMEIILDDGIFMLNEETKDYLNLINRGGLKSPSSVIVCIIMQCYLIFQVLLSDKFESNFLSIQTKQHSVIIELMKILIIERNLIDLDLSLKCSECEVLFYDNVLKILNTFVNICLNNYTKMKMNTQLSAANERKLKKFKS